MNWALNNLTSHVVPFRHRTVLNNKYSLKLYIFMNWSNNAKYILVHSGMGLTISYNTVLHCNVLLCTKLYCTILYRTVPYCTFLHTCFLLLNESILIRNEFIPIWYEFILSQCMYFTKSVLEHLRIILDKKFFMGLIVIKKCEFLKLFLHLNSEVWGARWVWIQSNVEGIHTSFVWIHSTCEGIQTETGIPLL